MPWANVAQPPTPNLSPPRKSSPWRTSATVNLKGIDLPANPQLHNQSKGWRSRNFPQKKIGGSNPPDRLRPADSPMARQAPGPRRAPGPRAPRRSSGAPSRWTRWPHCATEVGGGGGWRVGAGRRKGGWWGGLEVFFQVDMEFEKTSVLFMGALGGLEGGGWGG